MKFYELDTLGEAADVDICIITKPPKGMGVKYTRLSNGKPAMEFYPEDANITLETRYLGKRLSSLIGNTQNCLIVDSEMKNCIESFMGDNSEYLQFTLYDQKKKLLSEDCFIVNPLGTIDCLNLIKSDINYNEDGDIIRIKRMVFKQKESHKFPVLFRVKQWPSKYIINQTLYEEFIKNKFTNIVVDEVEIEQELPTG